MGYNQPTGSSGGIEMVRLHYPPVDEMNEDFLCGICKSKSISMLMKVLEIVLNPLECSNKVCGALFCSQCLEQ